MSRRVVIVDGHSNLRFHLRRFLASLPAGYEVVGEAATAAEATPIIEAHQPDLLLMDVDLPDISGLDLAARIRQRYPGIKLVLLTEYDASEYELGMARAQGYAFVTKTEMGLRLPQVLQGMEQADMAEDKRETAPGGSAGSFFCALPVQALPRLDKVLRAFGRVGRCGRGVGPWLEAQAQTRGEARFWGMIHMLVAMLCVEATAILSLYLRGGALLPLTSVYLAIFLALAFDMASLIRSRSGFPLAVKAVDVSHSGKRVLI